ncbi:1-aminocyclopropane-1-carboxylate synthase 7 [Bienertia sinuspersici]
MTKTLIMKQQIPPVLYKWDLLRIKFLLISLKSIWNNIQQPLAGAQQRVLAMASFMEQIRGGKAKFDYNRIVLTAGATAANELLTFIIADPDLRWRTGVNIVPIHCDSSNNFQVTPEALEDAYGRAEKMKSRVRGVLITNPSNPLGATIDLKVLEEILDFVSRKNIHLVSDEIYSGSVFSPQDFTSIAEVLQARNFKDAERVHIVYSLSKDLGLPGFRVGTIYSYNDKVVTTARRMSSFTLVSSQTQHLLAAMLSDEKFTAYYIKTNRERLTRRYHLIINGLRKAGIECLKGNAGLFCWMNLSPFLNTQTTESELALSTLIIHDVKLNISPGSSCHCSEPGWFRVCFANMSEHTLEIALKRLNDFMEQRNFKERE